MGILIEKTTWNKGSSRPLPGAPSPHEGGSGYLVDKTLPTALIRPRSHANGAYLFERPLRAHILATNEKDDASYESEGMTQHELFHFPVVDAAPVRPGQERPPDFDLASFFVVFMESGRPDDPAIFGIDGDQRSAGFQCLAEEQFEDLFFVAISDRMLFPDKRVCRHGVQIREILGSKRPELEQLAFEEGLEIKGTFSVHAVPGVRSPYHLAIFQDAPHFARRSVFGKGAECRAEEWILTGLRTRDQPAARSRTRQ